MGGASSAEHRRQPPSGLNDGKVGVIWAKEGT
jgi:hypothetical protein